MPVLVAERPTKDVALPESGGVVKIKTYLNAFEKEQIENALKHGVTVVVDPNNETTDKIPFPVENQTKARDKLIELSVVKWDFTDAEEKGVEPTVDNIKKLSTTDTFQIRSVSTKRFIKKIGSVSPSILEEIKTAIKAVIDTN